MGLKSLMARLKSRAADTPDTPEKNTGYQPKAPIHAGCTPDTSDTPCFSDTRANMLIGQFGEAVNDPEPKPPTNPNDWRELAAAYNVHHFKCSTCIAAGRGAQYGLRCGAGAALWGFYQDSNLIQQKRNTR